MIHLFSKVEKSRKGKRCLFCKPHYDEKLAQRHLLKEYGILKALELWKTSRFKFSFEIITAFESHEARKAKNSKLYWFCKPLASWKITQRRLLTIVMAFESSEVWKIFKKKFSPFLTCKFELFWKKGSYWKSWKSKTFLKITLSIL